MPTAVIDAAYDGETTASLKTDTGSTFQLSGTDGGVERPYWRFSLSSITAGSTVDDSDFQCNVTAETLTGTDQVNINAYNSTGDDDPELDAAATAHTRCAGTTLVSETALYQSTGSKSSDLGATADSQIQGNISSPGFYSIAMTHTNFGAADTMDIEAIENVGTDPATLTVVYTEPTPILAIVSTNAEIAFRDYMVAY